LKLPRDEFVIAIESIIKDFNIAEPEAHSIEKTFTRLQARTLTSLRKLWLLKQNIWMRWRLALPMVGQPIISNACWKIINSTHK
jgi:hypothetical protein